MLEQQGEGAFDQESPANVAYCPLWRHVQAILALLQIFVPSQYYLEEKKQINTVTGGLHLREPPPPSVS